MSQAPAYNLLMKQGEFFFQTFNVATANGAPADLSAYSAVGKFRKSKTSTNSYSFSTTIANNQVTISMDSSNTVSVPQGSYVYDVFVTRSAGTVCIAEGILTVDGAVSFP